MSDKTVYQKLKEPFPLDAHEWKPGATTRDKDRCLALAYVAPRAYIERLNDIDVPWEDDYETIVLEDRIFIVCRLTIEGQTRTDVGEEYLEKDRAGANVYTTAIAQAFKRACVKFGLGGYLYSLPSEWVDYDNQHKCIKPSGLTYLQGMLAYHLGESDTQPGKPAAQRPTQPSPQAESARERAKTGAKPPATNGKTVRPAKPEVVKGWLEKKSADGPAVTASQKQAEKVAQLAQEVWVDDKNAEQNYHSCIKYLFGVDSSKKLTKGQASAMISYLKESDESWDLHPDAIQEMKAILTEAIKDAGQQTLPLDAPFEGEWEDTTV